jgi:threonine dehydrogenase-like Zn-dependent dehydrogenase
LEPATASWFAPAKIAFMGARAARHALGDSVVVIGAGPIGQMAVRWAAAAGARAVVVVDPFPQRLEHARRGGATVVIGQPVADAREDVRAAVGPDGPDVVIDATGTAEVLTEALGLVRSHGRIVVLGDTGAPSVQRLTSDVIVRGITVVGAHDSHSMSKPARDLMTRAQAGDASREVFERAAALGWDGDRGIHSLFFQLVATGRFSLDGLNTHVFDPRDCAEAYRLAEKQRGETLGILFDWSGR